MLYDYVIVGSGFFGSTFANLLKESGKNSIILEKRNHIGGNSFTENVGGIHVHKYGPHFFHTSNKSIYDYLCKFTKFNSFTYRPRVKYKDKLYSFPINLLTLYQMWGCDNPEDARKKLDSVKIKIDNPSNIEEYALSQVGEEIYNTFIYGYTKKQWGTDPKNLPTFIIKRIPIRLNFNDCYFDDTYQVMPVGGYTQIFENMTKEIAIEKGVDFLKNIEYWIKKGKKVVYTGALDELFNYCYGELKYRSLRFETENLNVKDYQGVCVINYTDENVPYTRVVEHKHCDYVDVPNTIITKEYPQAWNKNLEKYYPVNDEVNNELYKKYELLAKKEFPSMIFGGRLASYKYFDMHQVIGQAFHKFEIETKCF